MLEEFKKFLFRGNVIDLLVGVVIGTSFGAMVNAFVIDFVMPFIGALVKIPDFSKLEFVVNGSTFAYGHFLNTIISFILIASVIFFFIVKPINAIMSKVNKKL
ncbi:MAG: large conductance mechanosensitive channel protein MscL [Candidatus Parcubacteria bacterium]|nr:large conductance mechanosensitive channel protein MscL [Candidatus Parcubacteria bacterium]